MTKWILDYGIFQESRNKSKDNTVAYLAVLSGLSAAFGLSPDTGAFVHGCAGAGSTWMRSNALAVGDRERLTKYVAMLEPGDIGTFSVVDERDPTNRYVSVNLSKPTYQDGARQQGPGKLVLTVFYRNYPLTAENLVTKKIELTHTAVVFCKLQSAVFKAAKSMIGK